MNPTKGYLHPFACFHCRRSFKRPWERGVEQRPCPNCGAPAVPLNRKFKPPRADDAEQWKKVEYLVRHGFRFQSIYDSAGNCIAYPETLKEAVEFVKSYGQVVADRDDA